MVVSIPDAELREEVSTLRKKVVALETAEADNEKLRKELSKLRVQSLEQKSTMELDFMNQLTGVARENSLKLEEMEGRLLESTNVNLALSEKLKQSPTPDSVRKQMEALESQHKKDLATAIDANVAEITKTRQQVQVLMECRDMLVEELKESKHTLTQKDAEFQRQQKEQETKSKASEEDFQRRLAQLQTAQDGLFRELHKAKKQCSSKDAKMETFKQQLSQALRDTRKDELESAIEELTSLKMAKQTLEMDIKTMNDTATSQRGEMDTKIDKANLKIKELEATILDLTKQVEECKSDLSTAEIELDRIKSNVVSNESSLKQSLEEQKQENKDLKEKIEELEKLLAPKPKDIAAEVRVKALEEERVTLKATIRKIDTEKMQHKLEVTRLRRAQKDMTEKYEQEIRVLKQRCALMIDAPFDEPVPKQVQPQSQQQQQPAVPTTPRRVVVTQSLKVDTNKTKELQSPRLGHSVVQQSPKEGHGQPMKLFGRHRVVDDSELLKKKATPAVLAESSESNDQETKTTQIIRRFEESLKKEGKTNQLKVSSLMMNKDSNHNKTRDDQSSSSLSLQEMKREIASLNQALEAERNQTNRLRDEVSKLKAMTPSVIERKMSFATVQSAPTTPSRAKQGHVVAAAATPTRTPVRGLVEDYEMKISSLSTKRAESSTVSVFDFQDMDGLRDALSNERQQVSELEAELTRQCEMNCTLLKEISWLTKETENNRTSRGPGFVLDKGFDRLKIEKLTSEVSELKKNLKTVEDEKTNLSNQFEKIADSDRREIDRLTSELIATKSKLTKASDAMTPSSPRHILSVSHDRKEADRLRMQIRQLEVRLTESQQAYEEMSKQQQQGSSSELPSDTFSRSRSVQLEEQRTEVLLLNAEIERLKQQTSRVEELEIELAKLHAMKLTDAAHKNEVAGLQSLLRGLEVSLHESQTVLRIERETSAELLATVESLQFDLKAAETRLGELQQEHTQKKTTEEDSKVQLMNMVESLQKDLQTANEQRDEIEMNSKVQYTEKIDTLSSEVTALSASLERVTEERDEAQEQNRINNDRFDALRAEIDGKVEEFERTHQADRDEISRLQTQITSVEQQLEESLSNIESMKTSMDRSLQQDREAREGNLQRENQQSMLDTEITTLRNELASARQTETELDQRVESLAKTIEAMKAQHETALASKNTALFEINEELQEKQSALNRVSAEKGQLVLSMKDMTTYRHNEIDELQHELVEMSTRAANQAREIQTLKVQLDDKEYRKDETDRLRKRVRELNDQIAYTQHHPQEEAADGGKKNNSSRSAAQPEGDNDENPTQLENKKLRQKLRATQVALKHAEEKLRSSEKVNPQAMQALRDRNVTLKFEVEKLTKKLRKLAERKYQHQLQQQKQGGGKMNNDNVVLPDPHDPAEDQSTSETEMAYHPPLGTETGVSDSVESTRFMI